MRLFILELKRLLKTKSVKITLAICLALSILMAWLPVTYMQYSVKTPEGGEITETGLKALALIHETQGTQPIAITPERMAQSLSQYQEALRIYGNEDNIFFEMPDSEYSRLVSPIRSEIQRLREVYADPDTGIAPAVTGLTEQDALGFYAQCSQHLRDLMEMEQKKYPSAKRQAVTLYEKVKEPFYYTPGTDTNTVDYLILLIFLLVFGAVLTAAPVFSTEYQTGADDILRCTKHGRLRLAGAKILSALCILSGMFLICSLLYVLISNLLFGWNVTKTSVQIIYSAVSLLSLNVGGLQALTIAAGLMSLLATVCITLYISSKCRTNLNALIFSTFVFLLPMIAFFSLPSGELINWVQCLLPSGSIGLQNNYAYTLSNPEFLHIGRISVYVPFAILMAAAVEIPVFIVMTTRSYNRHKA